MLCEQNHFQNVENGIKSKFDINKCNYLGLVLLLETT